MSPSGSNNRETRPDSGGRRKRKKKSSIMSGKALCKRTSPEAARAFIGLSEPAALQMQGSGGAYESSRRGGRVYPGSRIAPHPSLWLGLACAALVGRVDPG